MMEHPQLAAEAQRIVDEALARKHLAEQAVREALMSGLTQTEINQTMAGAQYVLLELFLNSEHQAA